MLFLSRPLNTFSTISSTLFLPFFAETAINAAVIKSLSNSSRPTTSKTDSTSCSVKGGQGQAGRWFWLSELTAMILCFSTIFFLIAPNKQKQKHKLLKKKKKKKMSNSRDLIFFFPSRQQKKTKTSSLHSSFYYLLI